MILSATGHRPKKLGGYANRVAMNNLEHLATQIMIRERPDKVIAGMAQGWDTAWAMAAQRLKVPFIAAVPFDGQELRWPINSQMIYRGLLLMADQIVYVSHGDYEPWKMQARNEWMVDQSDKLVALWDGSEGGTKNCVKYAYAKGKPVDYVWPLWQELLNAQ